MQQKLLGAKVGVRLIRSVNYIALGTEFSYSEELLGTKKELNSVNMTMDYCSDSLFELMSTGKPL